MADDRYGGTGRREGWRDRGSSIFSDDDDRGRGSGRWSGYRGEDRGPRSGGDEDRGFFERAGDEVRSWFGDEEAERRREMDTGRDEGPRRDWDRSSGFPGNRAQYGGYGGGFGGGSRQHSGFGGGGGRSHWDDNYRRWRDRQIAELDRDYEEYCRDRQQRFDQDFTGWRSSRGESDGGATTRSLGSEGAGATTSGGTAASAKRSSTGSTGADGEAKQTEGAGGGPGRSRAS